MKRKVSTSIAVLAILAVAFIIGAFFVRFGAVLFEPEDSSLSFSDSSAVKVDEVYEDLGTVVDEGWKTFKWLREPIVFSYPLELEIEGNLFSDVNVGFSDLINIGGLATLKKNKDYATIEEEIKYWEDRDFINKGEFRTKWLSGTWLTRSTSAGESEVFLFQNQRSKFPYPTYVFDSSNFKKKSRETQTFRKILSTLAFRDIDYKPLPFSQSIRKFRVCRDEVDRSEIKGDVYNDYDAMTLFARDLIERPIQCDIDGRFTLTAIPKGLPTKGFVEENVTYSPRPPALNLYLEDITKGNKVLLTEKGPSMLSFGYLHTKSGIIPDIYFRVDNNGVIDVFYGGVVDSGGFSYHYLADLYQGKKLVEYDSGDDLTVRKDGKTFEIKMVGKNIKNSSSSVVDIMVNDTMRARVDIPADIVFSGPLGRPFAFTNIHFSPDFELVSFDFVMYDGSDKTKSEKISVPLQ